LIATQTRLAHRSLGGLPFLIDQLRDLLIRLSEAWPNHCAFYADPGIPWINNVTAQAIGRMKMRSYKPWLGMQTSLMLAGTQLV